MLDNYFLQKQQNNEAISRSKAPLCETLKTLGLCDTLKTRCKKRHFISPKVDAQNPLIRDDPKAAIIEYYVKNVKTATHYLVKLSKIKTENGAILADFSKLSFKLLKLAKLKNLTVLENPNIDQLGLFKDQDNFYKRIQIISKAKDHVKVKIEFFAIYS
jgi:hypothetical protein